MLAIIVELSRVLLTACVFYAQLLNKTYLLIPFYTMIILCIFLVQQVYPIADIIVKWALSIGLVCCGIVTVSLIMIFTVKGLMKFRLTKIFGYVIVSFIALLINSNYDFIGLEIQNKSLLGFLLISSEFIFFLLLYITTHYFLDILLEKKYEKV
jgi:hypothetical protein